MKSHAFTLCLALSALAAAPSYADTVFAGTFSSQVPPYETDTGNSWLVGLSSNVELAVGFQDTDALSYLLTQIQVADNFSTSNPNASSNPALNDLNIGLWVNTTNDPNTATQLQSWSVAPPTLGQPGQTFTVTSNTPTIITPGLFYFITENITPDGNNTAEWGWQENNLTPMQIGFYSGTFGSPGSLGLANIACTNSPCTADNDPSASGTPAFAVSGAAITTPEPATWSMLGAGLLAMLGVSRRKRSS